MLIQNILSNTKPEKAMCREHPLEYGNKIINSSRFILLFKNEIDRNIKCNEDDSCNLSNCKSSLKSYLSLKNYL